MIRPQISHWSLLVDRPKMRINHLIIPLASSMLWLGTADSFGAAVSDSVAGALLDHVVQWNSAEAVIRRATAEQSSASMFYASPFSLSAACMTGDYRHSDEAEVVQQGRGHTLAGVEAESYMRLSRNTVVWGDACFHIGTRRNILWNNADDYDLVGPYVIADSVGGNLSVRSYDFGGGYAGFFRGWTWGAQAGYTARISYRNRDPRDKIIVSDLRVSAGASRQFGGRYSLAIDGSLRVYNQESDIEFYRPNNDIRLYALTGLGNYYPRFSGNTAKSVAYTGVGFGGALTLMPVTATLPVFASLNFTFQPVKQILRDFNNLELTRSRHYMLAVRTGINVHCSKSVQVTPRIDALLHRQLGFENFFGTSTGNNYVQIGTRRNYYHDCAEGNVSVPVEWNCSQTLDLDITPAATVRYGHEDYRRPKRTLESSAITPLLKMSVKWTLSSAMRLRLGAGGAYTFARANRENLAGINLASIMGTSVTHNFAMLTCDASTVGGELGLLWAFSPSMALDVGLNASSTDYRGHGKAFAAVISAGLKF